MAQKPRQEVEFFRDAAPLPAPAYCRSTSQQVGRVRPGPTDSTGLMPTPSSLSPKGTARQRGRGPNGVDGKTPTSSLPLPTVGPCPPICLGCRQLDPTTTRGHRLNGRPRSTPCSLCKDNFSEHRFSLESANGQSPCFLPRMSKMNKEPCNESDVEADENQMSSNCNTARDQLRGLDELPNSGRLKLYFLIWK